MPNFESLVRPFQQRQVTPSRRIIDPQQAVKQENLILKIGEGGPGGKTFSTSYSHSAKWFMTKKEKEV